LPVPMAAKHGPTEGGDLTTLFPRLFESVRLREIYCFATLYYVSCVTIIYLYFYMCGCYTTLSLL
jgi:hypothetical protein